MMSQIVLSATAPAMLDSNFGNENLAGVEDEAKNNISLEEI